MKPRLLHVRPSPRAAKKYVATFSDGTALLRVHFGARGYGDFIEYSARDPCLARAKRAQYLARHGATEAWDDPVAPATLARYLLWERPTLADAERAFRRRFGV